MKTLSELILDVRFSTNENDTNRFPDERLIKFFNDAQDQIQAIIFTMVSCNYPFDKRGTIPLISGQDEYNLPSDIYAYSAISSVRHNGELLDRLDPNELDGSRGYTILGKKLYIYPNNLSEKLSIIYTRKLPRLEALSDEPELPSLCEGFLTEFVERKINAINSSIDVNNSSVFKNEDRELIANIFSKNNKSISYPPITNSTYLPY